MADQRTAALALFRQWIVNALKAKAQGNGAAYWRLLEQIGAIHSDADKLRVFSQCVSYFDSVAHEALLVQLLGVSVWSGCSDWAAAEALLDFAVNLASARTSCLPMALDFLVRSFMPPSCGIPAFMGLARLQQQTPAAAAAATAPGAANLALAIGAARNNKEAELQQKRKVLDAVCAAVSRVLHLVPTAPPLLSSLLVSRLPHRRLDKEFQCVFVEAMYGVAEAKGGEGVRDSVLAAVVDHLIHIDVEIRWEDIMASRAAATAAADAAGGDDAAAQRVYLFHMDLDDANDGDDNAAAASHAADITMGPGSEAAVRHGLVMHQHQHQHQHHTTAATAIAATVGDGGKTSAAAVTATVDEMADKMDALMELTFSHMQRRAAAGGTAGALELYGALMRSFDTTILDTYKSKFTQFLVFFACAMPQDPDLQCASHFIDHVAAIVMSPSHAVNSRLAAAAYWASFLARAKFVPPHLLLPALQTLVGWCIELGQSKSKSCSSNGSSVFSQRLDEVHTVQQQQQQQHQQTSDHESSSKTSFSAARSRSCSLLSTPGHAHTPLPTPLPKTSPISAQHVTPFSSSSVQPPVSPQTSSLFYSTCQAVLYVLCFRMRDIIAAGADCVSRLRQLPLEQLLSSPLQPLHHCLESIVSEFGHQAKHARLWDTKALTAKAASAAAATAAVGRTPGTSRNGENRLHQVHSSPAMNSSAATVGHHHHHHDHRHQHQLSRQHQHEHQRQHDPQLDMFFPFDPYLLRMSLRFIRPLFIHWREPDLENNADATSDDDRQSNISSASASDDGSDDDDDDEGGGDDVEVNGGSSVEGLSLPRRVASTAIGAQSNGGLRHKLGQQQRSHRTRVGGVAASPFEGFSPSSLDGCDPMSFTPPAAAHMPARLPVNLVQRF